MSEHAALQPTPRTPPWISELVAATPEVNRRLNRRMRMLRALLKPRPRRAAVLVLLTGDSVDDGSVVLVRRASTLRTHKGQVAFPGGSYDPGDDFPVGTALREAVEEVAVDPAGIDIVATLQPIPVIPSQFLVTPVVAYERVPSQLRVVDRAETEVVLRVPLRQLLDPGNRFQVRVGGRMNVPAFQIDDLVVWGMTGVVLASLTAGARWDIPWDRADVRDMSATVMPGPL